MVEILFWIFAFISTINVIHFGMYLIGADYYDVRRRILNSRATKKRRSPLPLVSVLIPAHNEEISILRTLESVRKSTYRKLEVIVIDDASTDLTRSIVRAFIRKYPKMNLRLMSKRKNVGKAGALNHALKTGVHGDLIMTLDSDSAIHPASIRNAVRYFDDPSIVGVAANVRVLDSYNIIGLLQKFEYMVSYRSKKFFSITNSEIVIGGVASTYRASMLKQVGFYDDDTMTEDIALSMKVVAEGNKKHRIVYGADVLAMTEGVLTFGALLRQRFRWKMGNLQSILRHRNLTFNRSKSYSFMLTHYRLPMAFLGEILVLLEPLALAYVLYLCLQLASLSFIVGAYFIITLYLIWNIVPDEHLSVPQKLKMIAYAPVMYFIMYLMNVVQLVAIIRCLINFRQALLKEKTGNTWKSPERQGGAQVTFS